jgi:dipeptidyl-peptidase 4
MRRNFLMSALASTLLSALSASPIMAQDNNAAQTAPLTLERVFASPSINGPTPRSVKLSPDGNLLTSLRPRDDDRERYDLWAMDAKTGVWRMLLDSLKFGSGAALSEEEKMQRERARIGGSKGIVAYDWAPDGKSILVPLDGDLFLADMNGNVTRLTETQTGELNAKVSPRGKYVSFVRDQNVILIDRADNKERQITDDGKDSLSWGVAEFVAQEEIGRNEGLWWSPDDRRIAVARVDESGVNIVSRAAIGAEGTQVFNQRYPAAGTPNAKVDLYIMNADGSGRIKANLGEDADIYLARVDWTPDGKALLVQRQSRDQKTLDMLSVDPVTGASSLLFQEKSDSWVNLHNNLRLLKDGGLLWTSERDGFSHIYRFKNGKWTQLTKGAWEVWDIVGLDEAGDAVYFTGTADKPLENHLYRTSLAKGGGKVTRLTESGWNNNVVMDKTASRTIVTRSNTDHPQQSYLAGKDGGRMQWIEQNALNAAHPYGPYLAGHRPTEFGTIKASDGTDLHYYMIKPKIEPGKTYPVWMQHYGGPGVQSVQNSWMGALPQYIVSQGYIYFELDNRGGSGRGKAFENHIYRSMGGVEVADQLKAAAFLKSLPLVAKDKIVTYGWSYGGYMTLKLLQAAQGVFAAGTAGAPVTKWQLYDTHYTERYLGTPQNDVAAYAKSSAISDASKIADPLLLIHGMADDNVIFENSTALMAEMQATATPFQTMVYPGYTHRVSGPKVSVHVYKTILHFFAQNIKDKE